MAQSGGSLWGSLATCILRGGAIPTDACDMLVCVLRSDMYIFRLLTLDTLRPRKKLPL
jgi:hypothetical protein